MVKASSCTVISNIFLKNFIPESVPSTLFLKGQRLAWVGQVTNPDYIGLFMDQAEYIQQL